MLIKIKITDERVKRILIDRHHIESTILVEDRAEADELMYNIRPRNVSSCYALNIQKQGFGWKVGDK